MAIVSSIISILSLSKKGEQDEQAVKPPTMGKNTCEAIQLMELKRSVQHKISTSWERASCIKELTQSRRSIPESVISQLLDSIAESQAAFREFSHIADAIAKRHADIDNLEPREETSSEYESCSQSPATEIPASAISCDTAITLLPDRLGEEILHDIQESYPEEYTSTFPAQALANVATTAQVDDAKTGRSTLHRRSALPAPPESMESVNLVSIVRSNFGKDLSTVAMPIGLNEPLNLLQKLAEELEYCELLDLASKSENVVDRMVYISAFAVSGYASVATRAGRKPFNPLLGETFDLIREDKGFEFVAEKVSHHPPIMACHAQSANYEFYQDNLVKSKFWPNSLELIPSGKVNVKLPKFGDHLQWSKVATQTRNFLSGARYLEHSGTMTITSLLTGYKSVVVFKEPSYFSSAKNEVSVTILNEQNREVGWMSGTWDSVVWRYEKSSPKIKAEIWRARPLPENHKQMYGFTQFAIELNELTPDMLECLPYTDTRLRPDQRLLEEGRLVEAEAEKLRLEAKQRDARKRREKDGEVWEPKWFAAGIDGSWYIRRNATSQAEYFECRRTRSFKCSKEIERIF